MNETTQKLIRHMFGELIAFNQYLGIEVTELSPERIVTRFDNQPQFAGNPVRKILHGGVISTSLDQAGGVMAMVSLIGDAVVATPEDILPYIRNLGTIDLRVDYLRPGEGEYFFASSVLLRRGSKIAVTRMELTNNDDTLIAVGTGTYLVG